MAFAVAHEMHLVASREGTVLHALVVDDDPVCREMLAVVVRTALVDADLSVALARDGAEASEALSYRSADVVLTDLTMPRESGLDVLRTAQHASPQTNVILLSGAFEPWQMEWALSAGAYTFMRKPVRVAQLRTCIRTAALRPRDEERPNEPSLTCCHLDGNGPWYPGLSKPAPCVPGPNAPAGKDP